MRRIKSITTMSAIILSIMITLTNRKKNHCALEKILINKMKMMKMNIGMINLMKLTLKILWTIKINQLTTINKKRYLQFLENQIEFNIMKKVMHNQQVNKDRNMIYLQIIMIMIWTSKWINSNMVRIRIVE